MVVVVEDLNDNTPNFDDYPTVFTLRENTNIGTIIHNFSAFDIDAGDNSALTYSLSTSHYSSGGDDKRNPLLAIDSTSGILTVNATIDREMHDKLNFTLIAKDHGTPPRARETNVVIVITDENDNFPFFSESSYNFNIRENNQIMEHTGTVFATDADAGINSAITYSIAEDTDASSVFDISAVTGRVFARKRSNFEHTSYYKFAVVATDGGGLNATANVSVFVLDVNEPHNFPVDSVTASVLENVPPNTFVYHAQVEDEDFNTTAAGQITYSIVAGDPQGVFAVENKADGGSIRISKPIVDREKKAVYVLTIKALDATLQPYAANLTITVAVIDVNDEAPKFTHSAVNATVVEGYGLSIANVIDIDAFDADTKEHGALSYSFAPESEGLQYFSINASTGIVSAHGDIDREEQMLYTLVVNAQDPGLNSASLFLSIYILDINDNAPIWVPGSLEVHVDEEGGLGPLTQIQAIDLDGRYAKNGYSIPSGTVNYEIPYNSTLFTVNHATGIVSTLQKLDREVHGDHLTVSVTACDGTNPPFCVLGQLEVFLGDINDNSPVCKNLKYGVTLRDTVAAGSEILVVAASDADHPAKFGDVKYTLDASQQQPSLIMNGAVHPEPNGFVVSPNGSIVTTAALSFERAWETTLFVLASDGATQPRTVHCPVLVRFPKVNLFIDSSTKLPGITENERPQGIAAVGVSGYDPDLSATLDFAIVSGDPEENFKISSTGLLSVRHDLDYESTHAYNLSIEVVHRAQPNNRAVIETHFDVYNTNDNSPVFDAPYYFVNMSEAAASGHEVTKIIASDIDGDTLYYSIAFSTIAGTFEIDELSGVIRTKSFSFDREKQDVFAIVIKTTDSLVPPMHTAFVEVTITLVDQNDSPPYFVGKFASDSPDNNHVKFEAKADISTFVVDADAADDDLNSNSELKFLLEDPTATFGIDESSGTVTLLKPVHILSQNAYDLVLKTKDMGIPSLESAPVPFTVELYAHFVRWVLLFCDLSIVDWENSFKSAVHNATTQSLAGSFDFGIDVADVTIDRSIAFGNCVATQIQLVTKTQASAERVVNEYTAPSSAYSRQFLADMVAGTTVPAPDVTTIFQPNYLGEHHITPPISLAPAVTEAHAALPMIDSYGTSATITGTTVKLLIAQVGFDLAGLDNYMAVINTNPSGGVRTGTWQYLAAGQTSWADIPLDVTETYSFVIKSTEYLRFVPATDHFHGVSKLAFKAYQPAVGTGERRVDVSSLGWRVNEPYSKNEAQAVALVLPQLNRPELPAQFVSTAVQQEDSDITGGVQVKSIPVSVVLQSPISPDPEMSIGSPIAKSFGARDTDAYHAMVARFNEVAHSRVQASDRGDAPGIVLLAPQNGSDNVLWEFSVSHAPTASPNSPWLPLTEDTLLSSHSFVRLVTTPDFTGQKSISYRSWDGVVGVAGRPSSTVDESFDLGTFELSTHVHHVLVNAVNDRPAFTALSLNSLPVLPYSWVEQAEFSIGLTVAADSLESFVFTDFADRLSILLGYDVKKISVWYENAAIKMTIGLMDFITKDLVRYQDIESQFVKTGGSSQAVRLGYTIEERWRPESVNGISSSCASSDRAYNTGALVSSITAGHVEDPDSPAHGIAVVHLNGTQHGEWQYRTEIGPWMSMTPSSIGPSRASLLTADMHIRFLAKPQSYWPAGAVSLTVKAWDGTPAIGEPTDTTGDFPQGPFSLQSATVTVDRLGCDDVAGSMTTFNACCMCTLSSSDTACSNGCDGKGGSIDSCGVCGGNSSSCLGCDGVPYSGLEFDDCGVCNGNNKNMDCQGVCGGTAILNDCDICVLGTTDLTRDAGKDCTGTCDGTAELDTCGDCSGGTSGFEKNYKMDCTGKCGGSFYLDSCNVCQNPQSPTVTSDCAGTCFGTNILDDCGACVSSSEAPDFNAGKDRCGVCGGDGTSCGPCIYDNCGVCNGDGTSCSSLSTVFPQATSMRGGTVLKVSGAGFFQLDESACRFDANIDGNDIILQSSLTVISPTEAECKSPPSLNTGKFTVSVTMNAKQFFGNIDFRYYDMEDWKIGQLSPTSGPHNSKSEVSFKRLTNTPLLQLPSLKCIIYELGNLVVPGYQPDNATVTCVLPTVTVPQKVTLRVSPTGDINDVLEAAEYTFIGSAPVPTSAAYMADLSTIRVLWDAPVSTSMQSCADAFALKTVRALGSGASCHFKAALQEMRIDLGADTTVYPGTRLVFRDNTFYNQAVVYSYAFSGYAVVSSPLFSTAPTSVLKIASSSTTCSDLELSGQLSYGGGIYPLAYIWGAESSSGDIKELSDFLRAQSKTTSSIVVPKSLLTDGQETVFTLQVRNFLGVVSPVVSVTEKIDFENVAPALVIGPSTLEVVSGETFNVYVENGPSLCPDSTISWRYNWNLEECIDDACLVVQPLSNDLLTFASTTADLQVAVKVARDLGNARLKLSIIASSDDLAYTSSAFVYLTAAPPTLSCHINGALNGKVVADVGASVRLLGSVDSNFAADDKMTYAWSCQTSNNVACPSAVKSITANMEIAGGVLTASEDYNFELQVMHPSGTSTTCYYVVSVVEAQLSHVALSTTAPDVSLATSTLSSDLSGYVPMQRYTATANVTRAVRQGTFSGTWTCASYEKACPANFPMDAIFDASSALTANPVATVDIDMPLDGAAYSIKFVFTDIIGDTFSELSISTALRPTNGRLEIRGTHLEAGGWTDGSGAALEYAFYFQAIAGQPWSQLTPFSYINVVDLVVVSPGTYTVLVRGATGAVVEYSTTSDVFSYSYPYSRDAIDAQHIASDYRQTGDWKASLRRIIMSVSGEYAKETALSDGFSARHSMGAEYYARTLALVADIVMDDKTVMTDGFAISSVLETVLAVATTSRTDKIDGAWSRYATIITAGAGRGWFGDLSRRRRRRRNSAAGAKLKASDVATLADVFVEGWFDLPATQLPPNQDIAYLSAAALSVQDCGAAPVVDTKFMSIMAIKLPCPSAVTTNSLYEFTATLGGKVGAVVTFDGANTSTGSVIMLTVDDAGSFQDAPSLGPLHAEQWRVYSSVSSFTEYALLSEDAFFLSLDHPGTSSVNVALPLKVKPSKPVHALSVAPPTGTSLTNGETTRISGAACSYREDGAGGHWADCVVPVSALGNGIYIFAAEITKSATTTQAVTTTIAPTTTSATTTSSTSTKTEDNSTGVANTTTTEAAQTLANVDGDDPNLRVAGDGTDQILWLVLPLAVAGVIILIILAVVFLKRSKTYKVAPSSLTKGEAQAYQVDIVDANGTLHEAGVLDVAPSSALSDLRILISQDDQFVNLGMFYFVTPELDVIEGDQEGFFQVQHVFPDTIVLREVAPSWGASVQGRQSFGDGMGALPPVIGGGGYALQPFVPAMAPAALPSQHARASQVTFGQLGGRLPPMPGQVPGFGSSLPSNNMSTMQNIQRRFSGGQLPPIEDRRNSKTSLSKVQLSSSSESESEGEELPVPPPRASFVARSEPRL